MFDIESHSFEKEGATTMNRTKKRRGENKEKQNMKRWQRVPLLSNAERNITKRKTTAVTKVATATIMQTIASA